MHVSWYIKSFPIVKLYQQLNSPYKGNSWLYVGSNPVYFDWYLLSICICDVPLLHIFQTILKLIFINSQNLWKIMILLYYQVLAINSLALIILLQIDFLPLSNIQYIMIVHIIISSGFTNAGTFIPISMSISALIKELYWHICN